MTRGFYTGLAAALTFFVLSGLWLLSASQSDRDVAELTQLNALQVVEYAADGQSYLSSVVADAENDASFFTHGCTPQGNYCSAASANVLDYTRRSAQNFHSPDYSVQTFLYDFSCVKLGTSPFGFTDAYSVKVSINFSMSRGPVRVLRWVNQSDLVLVNSSRSFRSVVTSSGPAGVWEVRVSC